MSRLVAAVAVLSLTVSSASSASAVYNIRVLSDKVVDLTDLPSLCDNATSNFPTNDEKAAALAHWFGVLGNQGPHPYDSMPVEPILYFNNSATGFCAIWTGLYDAVAEGGMGWVGRHYEVGDHTVPELEYDGTRHYLDNTYKFYATKCDNRTILSIIEMDDVAGCGAGADSRHHWLCYHTPMRLCDDVDGYAPDGGFGYLMGHDTSLSRAWLPGSWLCRDAAGRAYFDDPLDETWASDKWVQFVTEGFHSAYRYRLGLRDGEHYTRYFSQLGTSTDYYFPTTGGSDPNSNHCEFGNGLWEFTPDLSLDSSFESLTGADRGAPEIHPASVGAEAIATFKIQSANVTTGCVIDADVVRADASDSVVIEASNNAGATWFTVWDNEATGTTSVSRNISDDLCGTYASGDARWLLNYLVRVRMTADGMATDAGLNAITITTYTVTSVPALPKLGLGRNIITVDYDSSAQCETISLHPHLKSDLYQDDAVDWAHVSTQANQASWSATLYADTDNTTGHVTFELAAPRAIHRVRMGGSIWIGNWWTPATNYITYNYRTWDGAAWGSWVEAARYDGNTRDNAHNRRNQSKYVEVDIATSDVTKVQFKFAFTASGAGTNGCGANWLRMEADYDAADATFAPVEVTYAWKEYVEPLPADAEAGGTLRTHTERISSLPHSYTINTGGDVAPRTQFVRVNLEGSSPEAVTLGYDDATDVGRADEIPAETYEWGTTLSRGKTYTVSTPPDANSLQTAGDDQELTDGRVKEPQVDGPWPDTVLAQWSSGFGTLEIVVDLGSEQTVGGARLDAFYSPGSTKFPESVVVETSTDGSTYTQRGTDRHKGAKYALNNWPGNWPKYRRYNSPDYGEFPNYGLRGNYIWIPFQTPAQARWVKFEVQQQTGAGIMLSEVHVWDALHVKRWTSGLTHEAPNTPPVLTPVDDRTTDAETPVSITLEATDDDRDWLTFDATSLPTGATFDANTRTFDWTPTAAQAGDHAVTFGVDDGMGGTDAETITIHVVAPDLDGDGLPDAWELTYFSTTAACVPGDDPDGDGLTNQQEYAAGRNPIVAEAPPGGSSGVSCAPAARGGAGTMAFALFLAAALGASMRYR